MAKSKREKIEQKAKISLAKAEKLMDKEKIIKASEKFTDAGDKYFEIGEWRISERCYYLSAKNYNELEMYHSASNLYRLSANCALLMHDFPKAKDYYNLATKTMLFSDTKKRDQLSATSLAFTFLCEFIQGHQDKALSYVKQYKADIDPIVFKEHLLIDLVHNLANSIYNEKEEYLAQVLEDYPKYKFRAAEKELIDAGILVALCSGKMDLKINLDRDEFERDEIVEFVCKLRYERLKEIFDHPTLPHDFKSLIIKNIGVSLGENISLKSKPNLPISLDLSKIDTVNTLDLPIVVRTNFPEKTSIGPIMITVEIDGKFNFFIKSNIKKVQIVSPKAVIGVELIPKETPVSHRTFPLEVIISNKSDGDAVDINIEFEFPEDLKLMRGTTKKNIYSLGSNEDVNWTIQVKALDSGEIPLPTIVSFKDGDGNEMGPFRAEIPVQINL